jgi:hypothetical protein
MKRILVFVTIVVLAMLASVALLAQNNPFVGTWKLNTAKSKYSPGPAPQSQTRTVEAQGDGIKVNNEGTAADGSRIAYSYTTNFDGKDGPYTGTRPNGADTIALKRINSNTIDSTSKKGGKALVKTRNVISKDGKIMTITVKGVNASGQALNNVLVWDKQ